MEDVDVVEHDDERDVCLVERDEERVDVGLAQPGAGTGRAQVTQSAERRRRGTPAPSGRSGSAARSAARRPPNRRRGSSSNGSSESQATGRVSLSAHWASAVVLP
jgi:hypothetical protein